MYPKITKRFNKLSAIAKKRANGIIFSLGSIFSLALFILPFIFRERNELINTTLSVSFSALSTVLTTATFIVAYLLYEKLSLDRRIMDKQADIVLQLVDFLKGRTFFANAGGYGYFIRPAVYQLNNLVSLPNYSINSAKGLLISSSDYDNFYQQLMPLMRSYWMPNELKKMLDFLEFKLYLKLSSAEPNELHENYITFASTHNAKEFDSLLTMPETTLASFTSDLKSLVQAVEQWIQDRSSIPVELRLWEPS